MALSPNVPVMAPGELITSARANAVRSNLDRIDVVAANEVTNRVAEIDRLEAERVAAGPYGIRFVPAVSMAAATPWATWVTFGDITVPPWAQSIVTTVHVNGAQATTNNVSVWLLRMWVTGQIAVPTANGIIYLPADAAERRSVSFTSQLALNAPGVRSLQLQTERASGASGMRIDTGSIVTVEMAYRG